METHRFEAPGLQFTEDIAPLIDRLGYSRPMASTDRAVLLGEVSRVAAAPDIPTPAAKTYDQLSESDRKRLSSMLMMSFHSPGEFISEKEKDEQRIKNEMQFPSDPQKQARFMLYLRHKRSLESGSVVNYDIAPPDMTSWQVQREKDEFSRLITQFDLAPSHSSTSIQDPMSDSSGVSDLAKPLLDAVATRNTKASITIQQSLSSSEKPDFAAAARMKLFGRLTREKAEWRPEKLLCKRFGELNPFKDAPAPAASTGTAAADSSNTKVLDMLGIGFSAATGLTPSIGTADGSSKTAGLSYFARPGDGIRNSSAPIVLEQSKSANSAVLELIKEEDKEPTEIPPEKPSIDLFRAIFEDSNDNDNVLESLEEIEEESDTKATSSSAHGLQNALHSSKVPELESAGQINSSPAPAFKNDTVSSLPVSQLAATSSKPVNTEALALLSSLSSQMQQPTLKQAVKSDDQSPFSSSKQMMKSEPFVKKEISQQKTVPIDSSAVKKYADPESLSSSDELIVETADERLSRLQRDQIRSNASGSDWISKKPKKKSKKSFVDPVPSTVVALLNEFDEIRKERKKAKKKSKAKKHEKTKKKRTKKSEGSSNSDSSN